MGRAERPPQSLAQLETLRVKTLHAIDRINSLIFNTPGTEAWKGKFDPEEFKGLNGSDNVVIKKRNGNDIPIFEAQNRLQESALRKLNNQLLAIDVFETQDAVRIDEELLNSPPDEDVKREKPQKRISLGFASYDDIMLFKAISQTTPATPTPKPIQESSPPQKRFVEIRKEDRYFIVAIEGKRVIQEFKVGSEMPILEVILNNFRKGNPTNYDELMEKAKEIKGPNFATHKLKNYINWIIFSLRHNILSPHWKIVNINPIKRRSSPIFDLQEVSEETTILTSQIRASEKNPPQKSSVNHDDDSINPTQNPLPHNNGDTAIVPPKPNSTPSNGKHTTYNGDGSATQPEINPLLLMNRVHPPQLFPQPSHNGVRQLANDKPEISQREMKAIVKKAEMKAAISLLEHIRSKNLDKNRDPMTISLKAFGNERDILREAVGLGINEQKKFLEKALRLGLSFWNSEYRFDAPNEERELIKLCRNSKEDRIKINDIWDYFNEYLANFYFDTEEALLIQ